LRQRVFKNVTTLTSPQRSAMNSLFRMCTGNAKAPTISKEQFVAMLEGLKWSGCAEEAWLDLCHQAADAQRKIPEAMPVLRREDVEALYLSPAYNCDRVLDDAEGEMIQLLRSVYDNLGIDGEGRVSKEAMVQYGKIHALGDAMSDFASSLTWDGDGKTNFETFCNAVLMLSSKGEDVDPLPDGMVDLIFDPMHTDEKLFVRHMRNFALEHRCVKHATKGLPQIFTWLQGNASADEIFRFLREYRGFNQHFIPSLQILQHRLPADLRRSIQENLEEEQGGELDEETKRALAEAMVSVSSVEGVDHRELFLRVLRALALKLGYKPEIVSEAPAVGSPGDIFGKEMVSLVTNSSVAAGVAALLYGSELVVPTMYGPILEAIKRATSLNPDEYAYFVLHISCDGTHASLLEDCIEKLATTQSGRRSIFHGARVALEARATFQRSMLVELTGSTLSAQPARSIMSAQSGASQSAASMYDAQAKKWTRREPNCLSDYTGRPVVFEVLKDEVPGKRVLDIGCGEGYCAREVRRLGAKHVVGLDVSQEMVAAAQAEEKANPMGNLNYLAGDACYVKETVLHHAPSMGLIMEDETGIFDVAMAVFLFNYVTLKDMSHIMTETFQLLKPNGTFVFSVPHPLLTVMGKNGADSRFHFKCGGYFSSRDVVLDGEIMTRDGKKLNVRNVHKTVEDYISVLAEAGFDILEIREAAVRAEHLELDREFFSPVQDRPLHMIFKVKKPEISEIMAKLHASTLLMEPKQIFWTGREKEDATFLFAELPSEAEREILEAVAFLREKGKDSSTYDIGEAGPMTHTKVFGQRLRHMMVHDTGAILTKLPIEAFRESAADEDDFEERAKLAYFLLCSATGQPEGSTRGRLFDVKSSKGLSSKQDNVLFSVVDTECDWHTDGASADRFIDTVGLLCIRRAMTGGEFRVANACNVHATLSTKLPAFLLYELTRSIPRDVLEKGSGTGQGAGFAAEQRRNGRMLALRVFRNCFPIFHVSNEVHSGDTHMRFRYMRYWIGSGHAKAQLPQSPLMRIACDLLDQEMYTACCFNRVMEPGEVVIGNNHVIAHAREAFKDFPDPEIRGRHKVRCWIQLMKVEQELAILSRDLAQQAEDDSNRDEDIVKQGADDADRGLKQPSVSSQFGTVQCQENGCLKPSEYVAEVPPRHSNEGYLVQGSFDSDRARYVAQAHAPVQYARPAQLAHTQVQHPWQAPAMFQPYAAPVTRSPTIQHRPANFSPEGLASTLTAQTSPIQLPAPSAIAFRASSGGRPAAAVPTMSAPSSSFVSLRSAAPRVPSVSGQPATHVSNVTFVSPAPAVSYVAPASPVTTSGKYLK